MIEVRVKDDDFGSTPGWILCAVDTRPPLEASRLERTSLGSVEEVGLLAEMARFEELPFREVRPLSESNSCKMHVYYFYNLKCRQGTLMLHLFA